MGKNDIATIEQTSLPTVQQNTPMAMLAAAVAKGVDPDQLKQLMDLQDRWEKNEARKAFNVAFASFKSDAVEIIKRTQVKDGPLKGRFHANLFDVVSAVTPGLSKHGLMISWKLTKDEKDWMEVACTLSHVAGHSEVVTMGGMPDTGPGRNAIQARGSAKSYLERYTATAILGLAAKDADDDGNGKKKDTGTIDDEERAAFDKALNACATAEQVAALWKDIAATCHAAKDKESHADFKAKVTIRLSELKAAA